MKLRPMSNQVLLEPLKHQPSLSVNIILPDTREPDCWHYRVIACGTKVPFDIQPGMRVILNPLMLDQREFDHEGKLVKLAPWREVQMVVGWPEPTRPKCDCA